MRPFKFFKGPTHTLDVFDGQTFATASLHDPNNIYGEVERIGEQQYRIQITRRPPIVRVPTKGERFQEFFDNKYGWWAITGFTILTVIFVFVLIIKAISK